MKRTASVIRERHVPAAPADVWAVIADPGMQQRLDPRCRLESVSGDWRMPGAEFVLAVRGVPLRYVVVEAEPGRRWTAQVYRGHRQVGVQSGDLVDDPAGTLLRWSVTVAAGALPRRLVRRSCERELPRWLAAVEWEARENVE